MKRFIFLCGAPRSGTTFAASIISAHPGMVLGIERFKSRYADRSLRPHHFEKARFFDVQPEDTTHSEATAFHRNKQKLFEKYDGASCVGDKYPNLIKNLDWVLEEFVDVSIIFAIRNPISVARSWAVRADKPTDKWPQKNGFDAGVDYWRDSLERAVAAKHRNARIVVADYDMLTSPSLDVAIDHLNSIFIQLNLEPSTDATTKLCRKRKVAGTELQYSEGELEILHRLFADPAVSAFYGAFDKAPAPAWRPVGIPEADVGVER